MSAVSIILLLFGVRKIKNKTAVLCRFVRQTFVWNTRKVVYFNLLLFFLRPHIRHRVS